MKLIQKSFLNGTREFELTDDVVKVRIKRLFREEKLTVGLSTLNPEPVMNQPYLEFHSRNNRDPVVSLLLNQPNTGEFNAFIDALKQRASGEQNSIAGDEADSPESRRLEALARNVYEEPPEFEEFDESQKGTRFKPVNVERLENDISMLKTYLDEHDIASLLDSLDTLKVEPESEAAFNKMVDAFNDLGIKQGAVLTYAPYLKVLLSDSYWA